MEANRMQDTTTEWNTLGLLIDPKNVEYINRLSPALFTGVRVNILEGMRKCYVEDGAITFEGLNTFIDGDVPGQLFNVQDGNITILVRELARLAKKRQALKASIKLKELSDEKDPDIDAIHTVINFDPIMSEEDSSMLLGAQILLTDIHQKKSGEYIFAKTGLRFLDSAMGGEWKPKSFVVYAGGAGTGKTTLVAQSMLSMALGYTNEVTGEKIITPSLFFSLEMAKEDLFVKWLGSKLEIDTTLIQNGKLSEKQFRLIEEETIKLQQLPMYIIDNSSINLAKIVYEIRKHVRIYGVRVVFIDYLQIANHHPTGNDNNDLGDFANTLKKLAKSENITIVALSQITPGKDGTFKIRDSGEVGAVADVVIQALLDSDEPGPMKNVSIDKLKNRFGSTGKTSILFNGPYQRFEEGTLS